MSELTDCSHPAVWRSCGGIRTSTAGGQRRSGLQHLKHQGQAEVDGICQSEEVDIVGLDGHIYKGRLNVATIRNTETKLPTISTKDGVSKAKDKPKCSSYKPSASPELGHNVTHNTSAQCSRSGSSCSARDRPPSTVSCTSRSSPAEGATEP